MRFIHGLLIVLCVAGVAVAQEAPDTPADVPADAPADAVADAPAPVEGDASGEEGTLAESFRKSVGKELSTPVAVALFVTLLAVLPGLLVATTAFTRIVIVLSFARRALSTQTVPPNQVVIGLSLFLTLFVMGPTADKLYQGAVQPYMAKEIEFATALERANTAWRGFMFKQVRERDLGLFLQMADTKAARRSEVPTRVLVPAFIISELRTAFIMGFMLFLPFLVIDLVVSTVLLSMGMMMLPPVMISFPFKVLLFVMVDGWNVLSQTLAMSFA